MGVKSARTASSLNKTQLAFLISELLDLPLDDHGEPKEGLRIVRAIITAITRALRRGESVVVRGFGIFRVVPGVPRRTGHNFLTPTFDISPVPLTSRARSRVVFEPSEQVRAMLNGGTTWDEHRAMEIWDK